MLTVQPFRALRPREDFADEFVAPPYDVLTEEMAKNIFKDQKNSIIRITRPEVNDGDFLPEKFLKELEDRGLLLRDEESFYIYEEEDETHTQRGIVYLEDPKDEAKGLILRHENTLKEKESGRIEHFKTCNAQTEPVFFFSPELKIPKLKLEKLYELKYDKVIHRLFRVCEADRKQVEEILKKLPRVYIADGHHRTKAAIEMAKTKDVKIMAVVFPADELLILPYHRLIRDIGDFKIEDLNSLRDVLKNFEIEEFKFKGQTPEPKEYFLLTEDNSLRLKFKEEALKDDVVADLDASIVQDHILESVFGINDPRTDKNIDFLGGNLDEDLAKETLEEFDMIIVMPATRFEEIVRVSDAKKLMPPKSTWFHPKLLSGLFLYPYD